MAGWPPLTDPAVREWLALDHDGWRRALTMRVREIGPQPFSAEAVAHALGYPWPRPEHSYRLRGDAVELLDELPEAARRALVAAFARDRHPLIAFGANGGPERLRARFAAFPEDDDRDVLVLTGGLCDVDVGAQAGPTVFGNVPGALFHSPGTTVRASCLWVTPRQLTELTRMELGYRLGRLEHARFVMDGADVEVDPLLAYVSRIGTLCIDGAPVALAAVPATGRRARALTQEELLDHLAALVLGEGARARDLVRRCLADQASVLDLCEPRVWPHALKLPDEHWTPYPT